VSKADEIFRAWRLHEGAQCVITIISLIGGFGAALQIEHQGYAFVIWLLIVVGIPTLARQILREREARLIRRLTGR
jgi:hypothetical protein